jgi:hypothetical protein
MVKPRLLDLFCGAGGCGRATSKRGSTSSVSTTGRSRTTAATFSKADALEVLAVLGYCAVRRLRRDPREPAVPALRERHPLARRPGRPPRPDRTRHATLLEQTGLPYVIENVRTTPSCAATSCCAAPRSGCRPPPPPLRDELVRARDEQRLPAPADDYSFDHGAKQPESVYRDAMGCGWMTAREESREAIPPAYTEFIGGYLLAEINARKEASAA